MVIATLARRSGAWKKLVSSDIIEQVPLAYLVARQQTQSRGHGPDNSLISRVAKQLDILQEADDATLKAMAQWVPLLGAHLDANSGGGADAPAAAFEHGAHLVDAQLDDAQDAGFGCLSATETDARLAPNLERMLWCDERMLALAEEMAERQGIRDDRDAALWSKRPDGLHLLIQASIAGGCVFFGSLFHKPFEWLYTGMTPLSLAAVLQGQPGTPLLMGIAIVAVLRRLGLPATLQPAGQKKEPVVLPDKARDEQVLAVWRALLRLAVEAHQRRGEGDAVAHWTHLLLAMDPDAPEWDVILGDDA